MSKRTFLVSVAWTIGKQVEIKAESLEEAEKLALNVPANNGEYVADSFSVDEIEEITQ